jgi:hypothetical protein
MDFSSAFSTSFSFFRSQSSSPTPASLNLLSPVRWPSISASILFILLIFLSSLASVLQRLFRIPPSYPCVAMVLPVSLTVPITMSAFGSQLILSAVARIGITIIGDDVQLGVGPELADGRLLGPPLRTLLVLVRTKWIC